MSSLSTIPTADGRTAWRFLRGYLGARKWVALAAGIVALATSACAMVPPLATGWLVDRLSESPSYADLFIPLAAMGAAIVTGAVLTWWGRILFARVAEPTVGSIREDVVDHALNLEAGVIEKAGTGELVSRVSDDSRLVSSVVSTLVPMVLSAATLLVLSVPGLFGLHWALGLGGLIGVPMYIMSLRWYLPRSGPLYREEREILASRTTRFLDSMAGRPVLVAHGWTDDTVSRLDAASDATRQVENRVFRMLTRYAQRNNRAEFVVTASLLAIGFVLVGEGWTTMGAVTAAALLYHRLFDPIGALVGTFDQIQEAGIALRRLAGVTQLPRREVGTDALRGSGDGSLALIGATHRFDETRVVDNVDLSIAPGKSVALVGATGAGKTTVARLLAGALPIQEGNATLGDTDIAALGSSLRQRVCLASQHTHVFSGTVMQNLCLGATEEISRSTVHAAITRTGAEWIHDLPDGCDTGIGGDGMQLSVHRAQHLALVRLLLLDPEYVVLDEATAEDGSTNSRVLDRAASEVVADRGALIIAHRLSQARVADRIMVMDGGRIVESGGHSELVAAGGRYAELWDAWSGGRS